MGFLTSADATNHELHPLLREFLLAKAPLLPRVERQRVLDQSLAVLIHHEQWDHAFSIIHECGAFEALTLLIRAALDHLLREGRVATVRRWLEAARAVHSHHPLIELAEAESAVGAR